MVDFMVRYEIAWHGCQRVNPPALAGLSGLPFRALR